MLKRGQLTIFIIIGVVMIGSLAFLAVNKGFFNKLNPEADSVSNFVQDCIKQTGENGIFALGLQGGYYSPPNNSVEYGIPYYYLDEENLMPSKSEIEGEINSYVNNNLASCINDFSDFSDLTIDAGEMSAVSTIADNNVVFNVDYPVTIRKDESSSLVRDFKVPVQIRLGTIYNSAEKIIQEKMSHEGICLSCMLDISLENDLKIDVNDYENETAIIVISDENSKINDEMFEFVFATDLK